MGVGGFLSFLKKMGADVVSVAAATNAPGVSIAAKLVEGFLPAKVSTPLKAGLSDLSLIASEVQSVEAVAQTFAQPVPGPQKLQAAASGVQQIVAQWLAASGLGETKVRDAAAFQRGVQELTSGVADILNSLEAAPKPAP